MSTPRKASRAKSRARDDKKDEESPIVSLNVDTGASNTSTGSSDGDLLYLDLCNSDDLIDLDNLFKEFEAALSLQKAKLAAKWISKYTKRDPVANSNNAEKLINNKTQLLIDKKSVLKHIEDIGMVKGRRFEDLEKEQNKAIQKLQDILTFETDARVARDKAIAIQNETELEMKQIDAQRAVIAAELAKAEPELKKARTAVSSISDAALHELVSLKKPPKTVEKVLTVAVWIINSKVDPMKGTKPPKTPKTPKISSPRSTGNSGGMKFFEPSGGSASASSPPSSSGRGKSPMSPRNARSPRPNKKNAKGARDRAKSRAKKPADILKQSWQDTRKLITSSNFKKAVLEFDPKTLAKHVCNKIKNEFLVLEDFNYERANKASKVLGPLVQWIVSLVGYGEIWYKIQPMAQKVSELEAALDLKTAEVEELQETSILMHKKVIEIRGEMLVMIGYKKIGELYFLS